MKLRISVVLQPDYGPSGQEKGISGDLRLDQEFTICSLNFLEVCRVLSQFDELAKKIATRETHP